MHCQQGWQWHIWDHLRDLRGTRRRRSLTRPPATLSRGERETAVEPRSTCGASLRAPREERRPAADCRLKPALPEKLPLNGALRESGAEGASRTRGLCQSRESPAPASCGCGEPGSSADAHGSVMPGGRGHDARSADSPNSRRAVAQDRRKVSTMTSTSQGRAHLNVVCIARLLRSCGHVGIAASSPKMSTNIKPAEVTETGRIRAGRALR